MIVYHDKNIASFSLRQKKKKKKMRSNSGGSRGGGGGGGAIGAPPPKKKKWFTVCFFHFFFIRMLKNKAQIARESIKTTLELPGPLSRPLPKVSSVPRS